MQATQDHTDTLNSLLRGELSAVETYEQALQKVGAEPGAFDLRRIDAEHREAVNMLRRQIRQRGGKPSAGSAAWGGWARAVEGTAKVFGNKVALEALKGGEEHGISSYERALQDGKLDPECRQMISARLLPQTRSHLQVLDRFLKRQ
jgi:uncharacterized protein (TIGR02284 family)